MRKRTWIAVGAAVAVAAVVAVVPGPSLVSAGVEPPAPASAFELAGRYGTGLEGTSAEIVAYEDELMYVLDGEIRANMMDSSVSHFVCEDVSLRASASLRLCVKTNAYRPG